MNPNLGPSRGEIEWAGVEWDSEPVAALMTSVAGATIAILATLVPKPLLNISKVDDEGVASAQNMRRVWHLAIQYFCGPGRTSKRFKVGTKIDTVSGSIDKVQAGIAE